MYQHIFHQQKQLQFQKQLLQQKEELLQQKEQLLQKKKQLLQKSSIITKMQVIKTSKIVKNISSKFIISNILNSQSKPELKSEPKILTKYLNNSIIIGYFHICQIDGWKRSFDMLMSQLKTHGLYEKTTEIRCGIVNNHGILIDDERLHDPKIKIIYIGKSSEYERPTLLHMHKQSFHDDPSTLYYYLHTKGLRHFGTKREKNVIDWINLMLYWNIERWNLAINALNIYDTYGCNMKDNHYSGNFWWAKLSHIKSLPNIIGDGYTDPEIWILKTYGNPFCIFRSGLEGMGHYSKRYPESNYRR